MNRIKILVGVLMMFLGILLLLAGSSGMILSGIGSCLVLFLIIFGMLLTTTGIKIPSRKVG